MSNPEDKKEFKKFEDMTEADVQELIRKATDNAPRGAVCRGCMTFLPADDFGPMMFALPEMMYMPMRVMFWEECPMCKPDKFKDDPRFKLHDLKQEKEKTKGKFNVN